VLTDEAPLIGRALQAVARIVRHEVRAAAAVEGQHERRQVRGIVPGRHVDQHLAALHLDLLRLGGGRQRGRDQAAEYDVVAALHRQPLFR
jgi:hypothetical protein